MLPPEPRYPNLRILSLLKDLDARRLALILSDRYQLESVEELDDDEYAQSAELLPRLPGASILGLVLRLGAQGVVVESDYIDRESNITYMQLYARAFRDFPRRTVRLHFFSRPVVYDDLTDEASLQDVYIGYSVLSPVKPRTIARTVLPAGRIPGVWTFTPCMNDFPVNLAGAKLLAHGTPFIQQDERVAACASAAAWMSTTLTAEKWGMPQRSMGEITQLATRHSLPPDGRGASPGLEIQQMLWGLHEMGYEPVLHAVRDAVEASELIYRYVESGIAPLLVIELPEQEGLHAVTVVGHTYDPCVDADKKIASGLHSSLVWVPHFLLHDDQAGAYVVSAIGPPNPTSGGRPSLNFEKSKFWSADHAEYLAQEWYRDASVHYVIAPLPPRHTLRPEQAADKGRAIITQAFGLYRKHFSIAPPAPSIFRTYFTSSNEYKRRFVAEGVPADLAPLYRGSTYPRYVWVTELCAIANRRSVSPGELQIVADVTIDPTSSPGSQDFITLHIPKVFCRMSPSDSSVSAALEAPVAYLAADGPYPALVRMGCATPP